MTQHLPYKSFKFLTDEEMASLDITSVPADSTIGYILEVFVFTFDRLDPTII